MSQIEQWLSSVEWYDNSRISVILNCPRKAWYQLEYKGGLEHKVGQGADFGTCIHRGLEVYYNNWQFDKLEERRIKAIDAYSTIYQKLFPENSIQPRHALENGISILDDYFLRYEIEDRNFEPVENEMAAIIRIDQQPSDLLVVEPFEPFWYVVKVDGLWRSKSNGDLWVKETKTTSQTPQRRIDELKLARQTRGYVWGCRQFIDYPERVRGVLADCIQIAAQKRDAQRDFIPLSNNTIDNWRWQTIRIVSDWRKRKKEAETADPLVTFNQNDSQCYQYGKCYFYDLCYYNPISGSENMSINKWTPFAKEIE